MTDENAARVVTPGGAVINTAGTSGDRRNGTAQRPAAVDDQADADRPGVEPQWTPPPGMSDPFVRRVPVTRAVWSRARRGHLRSAPTRGGDPGLRDLAVAGALANYGNADGSRCRPGVRMLADDVGLSAATVRRALAALVDAGWLDVPKRGARKLRRADEHHLTIPAPLAVELGMWDDDGPQWMERPAGAPGRRVTGSSAQDNSSSAQDGEFYSSRKPFLALTLDDPHQEDQGDHQGSSSPGKAESADALSVNAAASTAAAPTKPHAPPPSRQATIRRAVRVLADDGWPVAGPGPDVDADELADAIIAAAGLSAGGVTRSTIAGMAASGCNLHKIVGCAVNADDAAAAS